MAKHTTERWDIVLRIILSLVMIGVMVWAVVDFYQVAADTVNWIQKFTLTWGFAILFLMAIGLATLGWGMYSLWAPERIQNFNKQLIKIRNPLKWGRWLLVILLSLIPVKIILYTPLGLYFTGIGFRLALFCASAMLVIIFTTRDETNLINWQGALVGILILGTMFAFAEALVTVVDFPLSLTWSEGNRIWDYSILFGRDRYNYPADKEIEAYIDLGRQTLWGLPFLLPKISILGVRLWSALVFTVPYALLGWMAFRPLKNHYGQWLMLGMWTFLFLAQGPIYTPLVLSAILVVGARRKPLWIALPLIFLAGHYAQSSRITWIAAAAIWGVLIALLEAVELRKKKLSLKTWGIMAAFGLAGFLGGFGLIRGWRRLYNYVTRTLESNATKALPVSPEVVYISPGDALENVSSGGQETFLSNQPLLLERLLPNPTNHLGIILGLLLAAGPILLLLVYLIRSKRWKLNTWQQVGLWGILLALMSVGIIISTKIGGGGDLHNLDMFLISLVFAASLAWERVGFRFLADPGAQPLGVKLSLLFAVAVPAFMPWMDAVPLELPPVDKVEWTMELLQSETARIVESGGEILFMDQRQLLTFGYFGDIPLIPEYEKKLVMDRAMSGDREYLDDFYQDISNQRFALIITDPQRVRYADEEEGWGAENDAWVDWVTRPLLCYYDPAYTIKKTGVWLLVPAENPEDCLFP